MPRCCASRRPTSAAPSGTREGRRSDEHDVPGTVPRRLSLEPPSVGMCSVLDSIPMTHGSSGPTSRVYFSQRLRLHYVDWGNPSAPPLLLVHGGRDHCRNWDWVAAELSDRYHIIAPDLRGHGDSAW